MKINDLFGVDDKIEHFIIHIAEEELGAIKILSTEIKRHDGKMLVSFVCDCYDGERSHGFQKDLSEKILNRINNFHRNLIKNIEIKVYQK